ncbi:hypothetical protein IX55_07300 [Paracoccus sanguinis]|nr:hypothetical protein IX55_07300 [Paracoccus sanguinis]
MPALTASQQPMFTDIVRSAAPVMLSDSFRRLRKITFLGILSPVYAAVDRHPIRFPVAAADGSRALHSFRVALLAGKMAEHLSFSTSTIRYAVVWGLLHDIATWPLSHTGEVAFSSATETNAGRLRQMMIKGDKTLHTSLSVFSSLKEMSIDIGVLLALFDKRASFAGDELADLHQLIHSALTPDTLEGMHRSGRVFGLSVPDPEHFIGAMERDFVSGVRLRENHSAEAIKFWRAKGKIYSDFINKEETVAFESSWSTAIRDSYTSVDLSESLFAAESEIVNNVARKQVKSVREVVRYKAPLSYQVATRYRTAQKFRDSLPLETLSEVFVKDRA